VHQMASSEKPETAEEDSYTDDELDDLKAVNDEVIDGVEEEEEEEEEQEESHQSDDETPADDEVERCVVHVLSSATC
jgi:hypothetical protein